MWRKQLHPFDFEDFRVELSKPESPNWRFHMLLITLDQLVQEKPTIAVTIDGQDINADAWVFRRGGFGDGCA